MKTAVRRVLLMSALLAPGALYALGLGEIKLNSALNQPFDAEIELVSATQEDLGALRAALASNDTFARYGLDRPGLPHRLQLPRRQGLGRPGRPAGHVAAAGDRALRHAAGRGQLAARPAAARIHRAARSAGVRPGVRQPPSACRGRPARQFGRRHQRASAAAPVASTTAPSDPRAESQPARGRRRHRAGQHLSRAPERHALGDRQRGQPGLALGREPRDGLDLPEQPAGVRRQHQRAALGQHAADPGRAARSGRFRPRKRRPKSRASTMPGARQARPRPAAAAGARALAAGDAGAGHALRRRPPRPRLRRRRPAGCRAAAGARPRGARAAARERAGRSASPARSAQCRTGDAAGRRRPAEPAAAPATAPAAEPAPPAAERGGGRRGRSSRSRGRRPRARASRSRQAPKRTAAGRRVRRLLERLRQYWWVLLGLLAAALGGVRCSSACAASAAPPRTPSKKRLARARPRRGR